METIAAIINMSSDKIGFVVGVIFLLIAVFCTKPVAIDGIQLPAIDMVGRVCSGLIGIPLIFWAVFVWTAQSNVGIFSVKPPPASVVLQEEIPKQVQLSTGESIGVFPYQVSSRGSSSIILFELNDQVRSVLGQKIPYESLMGMIDATDVIWQRSVNSGATYQFPYNGQQHSLKVDRIDWFLAGPNYIVATIDQTSSMK